MLPRRPPTDEIPIAWFLDSQKQAIAVKYKTVRLPAKFERPDTSGPATPSAFAWRCDFASRSVALVCFSGVTLPRANSHRTCFLLRSANNRDAMPYRARCGLILEQGWRTLKGFVCAVFVWLTHTDEQWRILLSVLQVFFTSMFSGWLCLMLFSQRYSSLLHIKCCRAGHEFQVGWGGQIRRIECLARRGGVVTPFSGMTLFGHFPGGCGNS